MVRVDWAITKSDYQNVGTKRAINKDEKKEEVEEEEEEGESSLESSLVKVTLIVRMKRELAKHRKSQPSRRSQM